jgi:CubicO group peptidase (beta-lactamase class C family)
MKITRNTRLNMISLLASMVLTITITAQTPSIQQSPPLTSASPESVGMSAERLARIDKMCTEAIANDDLPGIVALVARKGKVVFHEAYGMSDVESNQKMRKESIFRIASQTKAITATAVMILWEEGKFQLDDPISKYIPEFEDPQLLVTFNEADSSYSAVPADKEITIRHLITHTSGIGYGLIDNDKRFTKIYQKAGIVDLFTDQPVTIGDNIKKLAKLPLHHNPGEKFTYSEGLDVLGYFVEVMSGMPFDEFLRKRLFDPLDMDDTWFYLPKSKHDRLVAVHSKQNGDWISLKSEGYNINYPIEGAQSFFSGGAGLSSTAEDYAKFLQMYLNGGEYDGLRILSRTTVNAILANQTGKLFWEVPNKYYGLAFGVTTEEGSGMGGLGSEGTFDWGGYFNTSYFADPVEQTIGIIMKQTRGPVNDQTGWKFRLLVGQAIDD